MITHTLPSGPLATNAYIVGCEATNQAVIIDPAPESAENISKILTQKNLTPIAIWLTHSHWDHIADAAPLKKWYKIPLYVHENDAPNLERPGADMLPCWLSIEGVTDYQTIKEGDTLSVGNLHFQVIETPGHTPGGVCFYCPEEKIVFAGDTLFKGSIGNISFPTSQPQKMWSSLKKLSLLPPETKVYSGHGPRTSIGGEPWLAHAQEKFSDDDDIF